MKNILKEMRNKGEMVNFAVSGIIGLVVVGVLLYVMFPILGGVSAATPTQTGALAGAQANATNNIAAGATLAGIVEIVIAAVVILGVLLIGLVKGKK